MDFQAFLAELLAAPGYGGQVVHVRDDPPRSARYADPSRPLRPDLERMLARRGITALYSHQARSVDLARDGRDLLVATGTASGKSLCYTLPVLESLAEEPGGTHLLLFPTKALCQDQLRALQAALDDLDWAHVRAGIYDGDTPADVRRRLRDGVTVLLTNPDMLHAALMPQHARWASFLSRLRTLVVDELHVYNGVFGANAANLFRRLHRVCRHHGAAPRLFASTATVGNPAELAGALFGRTLEVVGDDGSPRGRRITVFWDPPIQRSRAWRSRRSANVEAHELMAALVARGVPTITFSKAKMTAEMIARYARETLERTAPQAARKVAAYRGGYLPDERRAIERDLFEGRLLGVSTTNALELGIDVGGLDASIVVGYPGTLASFFQQAGRAGRRDRDALVVLVGLDTTINQYVMGHPEYLFGRPVERCAVDADNPFVVIGHLRCAAHELAIPDADASLFGPHADSALRVLAGQRKVRHIEGRWYHAASETPQHETTLRAFADAEVMIQDADTGAVIAELNEFDAQPIIHPEAVYMQHGQTYRVLSLDQERRLAVVKREDTDYYTQPIGGTDIHHIDHCLRQKPFGTGQAFYGEVTAYFLNVAYEKIPFYTLDAVSEHGLDLKPLVEEGAAFWLVPPEALMREVLAAGMDPHRGLRAIGYATRMVLPLFITCDTASFSHSVGAANAPWNTLFIYERFPLGLGFTLQAYERLHELMPAVARVVRECPCAHGCPCCVGKPLRQATTWNVERGEGSIPSKRAALAILDGLLQGDLDCADTNALSEADDARRERLEQLLRRRMERHREPWVFHPIEPHVPTEVPPAEPEATLDRPDVSRRIERRAGFEREVRKRMAERVDDGKLPPRAPIAGPPAGAEGRGDALPPAAFAPPRAEPPTEPPAEPPTEPPAEPPTEPPVGTVAEPRKAGDPLASRARRLRRGA